MTMKLDDKGRCCGRKPIAYKGGAYNSPGRHRFCCRCYRAFHFDTGEQIENWAWKLVDGEFVSTKKEPTA